MKEKVEDMFFWLQTFSPVICLGVGIYINERSMKDWDHWLAYTLQIILAVIGLVSTITILESKLCKIILGALYVILIILAIQGFTHLGKGTTGTKVYRTSGVLENNVHNSPAQSSGAGENSSNKVDKTVEISGKCTYCGGSGYCDKCDFLGEDLCTCNGGSCPSCSGIGHRSVYTKDGYKYPDCRTCGGSGLHERCNGTGFITCTRCDGTGACPYCNGTGER